MPSADIYGFKHRLVCNSRDGKLPSREFDVVSMPGMVITPGHLHRGRGCRKVQADTPRCEQKTAGGGGLAPTSFDFLLQNKRFGSRI